MEENGERALNLRHCHCCVGFETRKGGGIQGDLMVVGMICRSCYYYCTQCLLFGEATREIFV